MTTVDLRDTTIKSTLPALYVRTDIPAAYREAMALANIDGLTAEEAEILRSLDVGQSTVLGQSSVLKRIR